MDNPTVHRVGVTAATPWRRDDPRRRLWGPITVRVAWELVVGGIRVRPQVLREVREHALWLIRPDVDLSEADTLAAEATCDWLARLDGVYRPIALPPDLDVQPSLRWRELIHDRGDMVHDAVFRLHYGDGRRLEDIEHRTRIDGVLLRAAREAVREMTRQVLAEDGVDAAGWDPARLDRIIARIAVVVGDQCPGPGGLATDAGRAHAVECPRCTRVIRLLREGILSPSDLHPPEDTPCLQEGTLDLVLIQVQSDHRRALRRVLASTGGRMLDRDTVVVDLATNPGVDAALRSLAERGAPAAAHLRVVRRAIRGRWGKKALLGPGIVDLLRDLEALPWGDVRGLERLPEVIPPPPSAARWWTGAALFGLLALLAGVLVSVPSRPDPDVVLTARATPGGVRFDTAEDALVDVIAVRPGGASVVFHSATAADKGDLATGDGQYEIQATADSFLVVGGLEPFADLELVLAGFGGSDDARALVVRLQDRFPTAAVELVRAAATTP